MPDKDSALVFSTLKARHVVSYFRTFEVELIHGKLVLLCTEMVPSASLEDFSSPCELPEAP